MYEHDRSKMRFKTGELVFPELQEATNKVKLSQWPYKLLKTFKSDKYRQPQQKVA